MSKPEFYVIRMDRKPDPQKAIVGNMPVGVAPRNRNRAVGELRAFEEPQPDFAQPAPNAVFEGVDGYGQELLRSELKDPVVKFTTQEAAEACAKDLAERTPKVLYGVLGVISLFETSKPTLIEKKFNERGELVLANQGVKV